MCVKEGICKYDMWYGVVCKAVKNLCCLTHCLSLCHRHTPTYGSLRLLECHTYYLNKPYHKREEEGLAIVMV